MTPTRSWTIRKVSSLKNQLSVRSYLLDLIALGVGGRQREPLPPITCPLLLASLSARYTLRSMAQTLDQRYFTSSLFPSSRPRMRALENQVHEASHNNLFATPALHQHLQFLYAFPVFRIVQDYRRTHLLHHKYLGDPRKDPDILRLFSIGLDRLPEKSFWYLFGLPITGFLTYEYITTTFLEFWRSSTCWLSKSGFWASILMILALQELLLQFIYYYLVPFLVILPVIRYWAEISEHLGLDLRSCLGSSRTNIGFIHRWYLNPHNDGYHTVHHLCSQVPFYLLPRAHKQLMERSMDFAGKSVVSYGVRETFGQMMVNKTRTKE